MRNIGEGFMTVNVRKGAFMKKTYKQLIIGVGIFSAILGAANITTYALKKQNLVEYFFQDSMQEKKDIANRFMIENGKNMVVDGYTVTLESELYDSKTGYGYCYFTIKKDGMDMRDIYTATQPLFDCFGENGRYTIMPLDNPASLEFEKDRDKLNIYVKFTIDKPTENDRIQLIDLTLVKSDYAEAVVGEFELKDSQCSMKLKGNASCHVQVSPFAIYIEGLHEINSMVLNFKDGKSVQLITDGVIEEKEEGLAEARGENGEQTAKSLCIFKEPQDYTQVKSLVVDGVEYR